MMRGHTMPTQHTVLLLGGTGRTGRRVLGQLLDRGVSVRAIVRSADRFSPEATKDPKLTVVEADLLSLTGDELLRQVRGCDAAISCLGHVTSLKGIFGPPRDLVSQATMRVCRAIEELQPAQPVKFILMSSVSVNRPEGLDTRRGMTERAFLQVLRGVLPPARDNQRAADYLWQSIGTASPFIQWVVVRPDTLLEDDPSEYALHEGLVSSLWAPDSTSMANVAHFMCELVESPTLCDDWTGQMPVIVNAGPK
jgi:nucleoside-diphosphate-sugar epimerase